MRLIDGDKLILSLNDNYLANSPTGNETLEVQNYRKSMCDGLEIAMATVEAAPTVSGWVSVRDRLPESGKHVLLSCEIRLLSGRREQYTCVGFYSKAHTLSERNYLEDDEPYDYDEEEDEYYLKEGWYEAIHNWGEYSSVVIDDFVTHWMPLQEPPEEVPNGNEH